MAVQLEASRILLVEPTSAYTALLRRARELEMETVVASYDEGDRRLPSALREHVDRLVVLETNDEAALTAAAVDLHRERPLCGIVPGFEFYVESVGRIAARLGLPGLPVAALDGVRHKAVMLARAAEAGLRVPRYAEVGPAAEPAELDAAAAEVGYPLVLKPADSAGSVHVSRVDDGPGLHRAYQWMRTDSRPDLGRLLADGRAVLAEYIDGPEISVDGYVVNGEAVVVSVTGKLLGPEPSFVEVCHIVQADLTEQTRGKVESYVRDLCRAVGLTLGPFHCELRLPAGDPVLIEIGARLAGGHIVDLVEMVSGVSLPGIMLAAYTGLDLDMVAPPAAPRAKYAGIGFFIAPQLDVFTSVSGLTEVRGAGDVLETALYLEPGEPIPPLADFRARLGHVIYTADSHAEALARWTGIQEGVRFA